MKMREWKMRHDMTGVENAGTRGKRGSKWLWKAVTKKTQRYNAVYKGIGRIVVLFVVRTSRLLMSSFTVAQLDCKVKCDVVTSNCIITVD